MLSEEIYGSIMSKAKVQKCIEAHLRLWLPTYLCEVDEQEEFKRGFTKWPASFQKTPRFNNELLKQLPAILIICPGTTGKPIKEGDGNYRATYTVGISALVKGPSQEDANDIAGRYGAALMSCMLQQKGSIAPNIHGVAWEGDSYDDIAVDAQRTLSSTVQHFSIEFSKVVNDKLGPGRPAYSEPEPPPNENPKTETFEAPPEIPDEEHISVTIEPKES